MVWLELGFLSAAGALLGDRLFDPARAFCHGGKTLEIIAKELVRGGAILKAFEIGFQFGRGLRRKAVDDPGALSGRFHHLALSEVGQMLGNLGLGNLEDILEMTDAKRAVGQQVHQAKPRLIAETLIDLDELHEDKYCRFHIYVNTHIYFPMVLGNSLARQVRPWLAPENNVLGVIGCTVVRMDFLVSWNFRHRVNVQRETAFNCVNLWKGYLVIRAVSKGYQAWFIVTNVNKPCLTPNPHLTSCHSDLKVLRLLLFSLASNAAVLFVLRFVRLWLRSPACGLRFSHPLGGKGLPPSSFRLF